MTPRSTRSESDKSARSRPLILFSANADAYPARPREDNQRPTSLSDQSEGSFLDFRLSTAAFCDVVTREVKTAELLDVEGGGGK